MDTKDTTKRQKDLLEGGEKSLNKEVLKNFAFERTSSLTQWRHTGGS